MTTPQSVLITADVVDVAAELGNGGPGDLDYFTFSGKAGDVVTLDIDRGAGDSSSVDTVIAIFTGAPEFKLLRMNDDASLDEGSMSTLDSRIEKFVLPQTGRYIVGVSNYPRYFLTGGAVRTGTARTGDYQLVISGVTPEIKQVAIEVKPGSDEVAPVNPKSKGKIPVAILGASDFDVMSVEPTSLTFGAQGTEASFFKCDWTGTDVNGDGRVDRVCHFENQVAGFEPGDLEGVLRGRTRNGVAFEGRAFLKVVPEKRLRQ